MKIVCFGSMNIDYVYTVDHILAPGETLEGTSISLCAGGKGLNQAIALGRAGANCYMAGNVGQDGTTLMDELNSSNVNTSLIRTTQSSSGHTIIQVDKKRSELHFVFWRSQQNSRSGIHRRSIKHLRVWRLRPFAK